MFWRTVVELVTADREEGPAKATLALTASTGIGGRSESCLCVSASLVAFSHAKGETDGVARGRGKDGTVRGTHEQCACKAQAIS